MMGSLNSARNSCTGANAAHVNDTHFIVISLHFLEKTPETLVLPFPRLRDGEYWINIMCKVLVHSRESHLQRNKWFPRQFHQSTNGNMSPASLIPYARYSLDSMSIHHWFFGNRFQQAQFAITVLRQQALGVSIQQSSTHFDDRLPCHQLHT